MQLPCKSKAANVEEKSNGDLGENAAGVLKKDPYIWGFPALRVADIGAKSVRPPVHSSFSPSFAMSMNMKGKKERGKSHSVGDDYPRSPTSQCSVFFGIAMPPFPLPTLTGLFLSGYPLHLSVTSFFILHFRRNQRRERPCCPWDQALALSSWAPPNPPLPFVNPLRRGVRWGDDRRRRQGLLRRPAHRISLIAPDGGSLIVPPCPSRTNVYPAHLLQEGQLAPASAPAAPV